MTTPDIRQSQWFKSNLAALGSAAVLTVYAAGWARTKAAADLLDEQAERHLPPHRPLARATVGEVVGTQLPRNPESAPAPSATVSTPASAVASISAPDASRSAPVPASKGPKTAIAPTGSEPA